MGFAMRRGNRVKGKKLRRRRREVTGERNALQLSARQISLLDDVPVRKKSGGGERGKKYGVNQQGSRRS